MSKRSNKLLNLPSLPSETVDDIFKYIHDQTTLFSCLFVNRAWCRKIVPILWARPRPLVYKERSARSLIETYVSCFDDDERAILFPEEQLPHMEHLELKSPLFEYAVYLKELNYPLLRLAVRRCYRNLGSKEFSRKIKPLKPDVNPNRQITIMKALCNLFTRMSRLDSLVLDSYDDIPSVSLFTRGQHFINSLNSLRIHWTNIAPNMSGLIKKLPQICTGIRHLTIDFDIDNKLEAENLASIIRSQQSITTFELTGIYDKVSPILSALESQTESLSSVKLSRINYQWQSLDILGKCSNLKSLEMISNNPNQDGHIPEEATTAAKGASFSLRALKLLNQSPKLSAQVIRMGGSSLKSLSLNTVTSEIVGSILRSGTRISHLCLDISETPHLDFSQHLKMIEGLRLNYLQISSSTPNNINNLLSAMAKVASKTLLHLDIEQEFT